MHEEKTLRRSRKRDHIDYALSLADGPGETGFSDFHLMHNCLPELALSDIDLRVELAGIHLAHPLIIDAITGGSEDVAPINARLAEMAKRTGAAMAVGSQFAAIRDPKARASYEIVRQINPDGVIFANLGAHASPDDVQAAVAMIGANAVEIHLNPAQELMMAEGDRSFRGYLRNIEAIVNKAQVPVIVKETGCGIAREQADALAKAGVCVIDIGGAGGTNFPAIEAARSQRFVEKGYLSWGIPTAISTIEAASVLPGNVDLIVSGGVRTPLDAIKALALGGKAVAMAAPILRVVNEAGVETAVAWIEDYLADLSRLLLLTGCSRSLDARTLPVVISGLSREWLTARGIDTVRFAQRTKK